MGQRISGVSDDIGFEPAQYGFLIAIAGFYPGVHPVKIIRIDQGNGPGDGVVWFNPWLDESNTILHRRVGFKVGGDLVRSEPRFAADFR